MIKNNDSKCNSDLWTFEISLKLRSLIEATCINDFPGNAAIWYNPTFSYNAHNLQIAYFIIKKKNRSKFLFPKQSISPAKSARARERERERERGVGERLLNPKSYRFSRAARAHEPPVREE